MFGHRKLFIFLLRLPLPPFRGDDDPLPSNSPTPHPPTHNYFIHFSSASLPPRGARASRPLTHSKFPPGLAGGGALLIQGKGRAARPAPSIIHTAESIDLGVWGGGARQSQDITVTLAARHAPHMKTCSGLTAACHVGKTPKMLNCRCDMRSTLPRNGDSTFESSAVAGSRRPPVHLIRQCFILPSVSWGGAASACRDLYHDTRCREVTWGRESLSPATIGMFFAPKLFVAVFFFFSVDSGPRGHCRDGFHALCFLTEVLAKRLLPFEQVENCLKQVRWDSRARLQ